MNETDLHFSGKNFFVTIKQIFKLLANTFKYEIIIYIRQNLPHLNNSNLVKLKEQKEQKQAFVDVLQNRCS